MNYEWKIAQSKKTIDFSHRALRIFVNRVRKSFRIQIEVDTIEFAEATPHLSSPRARRL